MQLTARIEGAPEEMGCGGEGCARCSYAVRSTDAWACIVSFVRDPFARTELGANGRSDDQGVAFRRADVDLAVLALAAKRAVLRADEDLVDEIPDVDVALRLFQIAQSHDKPVRMES